MDGFKNTTRMRTFTRSADVAGTAGRTVGRVQRFARGGLAVPDVDPNKSQADDRGHALVQRSEPTTEEQREGGGKSPLNSGYAKGGKTQHFHVHKHYHEGGKIRTVSKSYTKGAKGAEREAEKQVEGGKPMMATGGTRNNLKKGGKTRKADGGHIQNQTSIPGNYPDYATGGTLNPMNAGGSAYGGMAVGGMPNRGVHVGAPATGPALGSPGGALAARRAAMLGRPLPAAIGASPLMRAKGGTVRATVPRSGGKR